jgi:hypothetical protein
MGIGSTDFTRRTETSSQNVLHSMQRPGGYNAGNAPRPEGQERVASGRASVAPGGTSGPVRYREFTFSVNPR